MLRYARVALTVVGLSGLILVGILQTQRDNRLAAARHTSIPQPRNEFIHTNKPDSTLYNQNDDVSKVVGIATFIVLLLQTWIFGGQAGLMRRQTDISDRQASLMSSQLDAAVTAAKAAQMSAAAAIGVELPGFLLRPIELLPGRGDGSTSLTRPLAQVTIQNYGRSPALITQHSVDLLVAAFRPKNHGYPSTINLDTTLVLEQGQTHIMKSGLYPTFLNVEAIRELQQSKTTLWVYGHVFYWNFLEKSNWFTFRAHLEFPPHRGPKREPYFVIDYHGTTDMRDKEDT